MTWIIQYPETYIPDVKCRCLQEQGSWYLNQEDIKHHGMGCYNGKPLPFDTYYYIIEPENGSKPVTGYVTIRNKITIGCLF